MTLQSREAKQAAASFNALKSVVYTAVLWAVFFGALPMAIRLVEDVSGLANWRFEPGVLRPVAVVVFAGAALIGFWGGFVLVKYGNGTPMPLDCTHDLVIAGPYRYIRNPMSAMGIVQGIMVGTYLGSPLVMLYAIVGAIAWHVLLRPWEEQDMLARFGEQYACYREAVPCWRPRLRPFVPDV